MDADLGPYEGPQESRNCVPDSLSRGHARDASAIGGFGATQSGPKRMADDAAHSQEARVEPFLQKNPLGRAIELNPIA